MNKEDFKIVFLGTPEFAVESLDRLVTQGYNVCGVVTMPDKPAGRGHKMFVSPVKRYALDHGIKLMQPVNLKDPAFIEELQAIGADLFIVIAFRMLPEIVWSMPRLGTFNLHASLLPKYRGAAPINRAIINGETKTGVTTFMLKHEIDTGDILQQRTIDIAPDEDAGSVHDRLMLIGAELTIETVENILKGTLKPISQDSLTGGVEPTPAPKIFAEDMMVDFKEPAVKVHNLVRGLSPYPAARAVLLSNGKEELFKIMATKVADKHSASSPGTIDIENRGHMFVACGDNTWIELLEVCPAGKRRMAVAEFLRGAHLENASFKA